MAQRIFEAEPLDALRWALAGLGELIHALAEQFHGMGERAQLGIGTNPRGEYILHDTKYGFYWHAFANSSEATAESILERENKRIPYLVNKLLRDLESGERIFVVRRIDGFPPHTTQALREAIAQYGAPAFLLVTQGGPPILSTDHEHGFLTGTVPQFADGENVPGTTDGQSWLNLCRAVHEHLAAQARA